jgi:hypothetical protein
MKRKYVLVGGVSKAGKSHFAAQLVRQYSFCRVPGDSLVMTFQETFPQLGIAHDPLSGKTPAQQYRATCSALGPFLVSFMNRLEWEGSPFSYVLDSFHVWPADLRGIDERRIQVLFFGYPDADPAEKTRQTREYELSEYGGLYCGLAKAEGQRAHEICAELISLSRELRSACRECGFPFVDTSCDFKGAISQALSVVGSGTTA